MRSVVVYTKLLCSVHFAIDSTRRDKVAVWWKLILQKAMLLNDVGALDAYKTVYASTCSLRFAMIHGLVSLPSFELVGIMI